MNLELINCVMFQDHLLTFDNLIMNAQVFGLLFTLSIFCFIYQVMGFFKKKEIPLLTKTSDPTQKDSSPSKGSKKRKEGVGSNKDNKKNSKKGKSEPHSAGVDNDVNDGFRTPEPQENMDLENAPNPPAAERRELSPTEEDRRH